MSNTTTHEPDSARQRLRSGKKGATRPTRVVLRLPDVSRRESPTAAATVSDDLAELNTAAIEQLTADDEAADTAAAETASVTPAGKRERSSKRRQPATQRSRWGSLGMQGLVVLSLLGILGLAYLVIVNLGGGPAVEEEPSPMMPGDPTAEIAGIGELQITAPTGEVAAPEWDAPPVNAFQADTVPAGDQPMPRATGLNLESPQLDAGYSPSSPDFGAGQPAGRAEADYAATPASASGAAGPHASSHPVPWQESPQTPIYQYNRTDSNHFQYPAYDEAGVTAGAEFPNTGVQR